MKKAFTVALVAFAILLILAIFISPMIDLEPTALRAQQWLTLIVAMFSIAELLFVCLVRVPGTIGPPRRDVQFQQQSRAADLACCLLC